MKRRDFIKSLTGAAASLGVAGAGIRTDISPDDRFKVGQIVRATFEPKRKQDVLQGGWKLVGKRMLFMAMGKIDDSDEFAFVPRNRPDLFGAMMRDSAWVLEGDLVDIESV